MVRNVDAVVHQLCLEVLVKQLKVDALFQRFVRCRIENGVDHLVEQRFLVDVTVLHNLLQRFRRLRQRVLVGVQDHGLGHLRWLHRYRLKLKWRIDGAVFAHDRILVRLLNRPVRCLWACAYRVAAESASFRFVHVFLQIPQCLVEFQIAWCLIQRSVHRLIELFLLHVHHLLDVSQLKVEQRHEGKSHDCSYCPNRSFFHIGKDKPFFSLLIAFC